MQIQGQSNSTEIEVGRFAPSPTGPLHFGSLIAALTSYLCARQHADSQWLLRIEDVDTQREQSGAANAIINTLEAYGFKWDREITYQSQRTDHYQNALDALSENTYPCSCTRKELQALSNEMAYGYNYPGLCRKVQQNLTVENPSIRLLTSNEEVCFQDECQPELFCQNIENDIGDFILKRRDGLFAYQLAVVVDDHLQGITQVVRGADLFDNTPRQIFLQRLLDYRTPDYLHFPVASTPDGNKLSKRNYSPEVTVESESSIIQVLLNGLIFLGQNPPDQSEFSTLDDLWQWAILNWNINDIPKTMSIVSLR